MCSQSARLLMWRKCGVTLDQENKVAVYKTGSRIFMKCNICRVEIQLSNAFYCAADEHVYVQRNIYLNVPVL